jgi:hypothetical protein
MAVGLFLVGLWCLGTRYELDPRSEFRPENVIQHVIADSTAARARSTAQGLTRAAGTLEAQAFQATTPDTAAKRLTALADVYRARAGSLASKAAGRDVVLANRHARRVLWVYAASVDVAVCIFVCLLALGSTYGAMRDRRPDRPHAPLRVLAMTVFLSTSAALLFYWKWYDFNTPPYALVGAAAGGDILRFMRANDALHILATSLILWGGVFTEPTIPPRAAPDADVLRAARDIARGIRMFRFGLYVAAGMLVVYVAGVSSLFQWVLAFVEQDRAVFTAVESLTNSAVTARGLLASGILVFGFGVSALVVRLIVEELANRILPDASMDERKAWAAQQGLVAPDLRQQMRTVAAILAPLATGVLAQALQGLT